MTDQPAPDNETNVLRLARLANEQQSSHQTLELADGRLLGFATYGIPSGPTVFFLHGYGDCRLTAAIFDEHAKKIGARVVGIDRPGWGLSSMKPGRTALDFVDDLKELVAHLHVQSYSIIGVSGGGPYALACAYALPPDQLKSVTMLCAIGPWDLTMRYSRWVTWIMFEARRLSPALARWMDRQSMDKYRRMTLDDFITTTKAQMQGWLAYLMSMHEKDSALFQNDDFLALFFDGLKENSKRDMDGAVEEWRVMSTSDLGFSLEEIRKDLPVELWYGRHDTSVSWQVGEALQNQIGGKARLFVREEAHLSIVVNCRAEVLEHAIGLHS